jgi:hypothetical protein
VSTPDSAEVHLTRLERDLAELQKATVPEPKPDPAPVRIAKLEKELEELRKPSLVSSSSVQSPPPAPLIVNQTSPVFMVQESSIPETSEQVEKPRLQGAEIIEQVRQTPLYMLARGELALRASAFMITEPSRVPNDIPHPCKSSPSSQEPNTIPAYSRHFRCQYETHHAPAIFTFHSRFMPISCRPDSGKEPPFL